MPSKARAIDVDEDEEILQLLAEPNPSERIFGTRRAVAPRCLSTATSSVFGTSSAARDTHQQNRNLAAIVQSRRHRKKLDEEIRELRQRANSEDVPLPIISNGNHDIEQMLEDCNKEVEENYRAHQSHKLSAPLFVRPTSWPQSQPSITLGNTNRRRISRVTRDRERQRDVDRERTEQQAQLLLGILSSPTTPPPTYAATIRHWCNAKTAPRLPPQLGPILFHRLVYDTTYNQSGLPSKRCEEEALHSVLRRVGAVSRGRSMALPIPNIVQVLEAYGADPRSQRNTNKAVIEESHTESLDHLILNSEEDKQQHPEVTRAIRNLGRAFVIWSQLVRARADLQSVFGESIVVNESSRDRDYAMGLGGLCVEVLLSPLGSKMADSVGVLLESLYERVPARQWEKFKSGFGKATAACTDRIGLLEALVVHLLPHRTERARAVTVETASVALRRWTQPVPSQLPTESNTFMSLTMPAIADIINTITPRINKNTDVTWLACWGALLKHIIVDSNVVRAVPKSDVQVFLKAVIDIQRAAHIRLPKLNVGANTFKLALTSMIETFKEFHLAEHEGTKISTRSTINNIEEPPKLSSFRTRSRSSKLVSQPSPPRTRSKRITSTPSPSPSLVVTSVALTATSPRRSKRRSSNQPNSNSAPSTTVLNPTPTQPLRRSSRKRTKR